MNEKGKVLTFSLVLRLGTVLRIVILMLTKHTQIFIFNSRDHTFL